MHQFFADAKGNQNGFMSLEASDAYHAMCVLRLKVKDIVSVSCESRLFLCEIISMNAGNVQVEIIDRLPNTEPRVHITLYQGLVNMDKMDFIIQKATELGVACIAPVVMARSTVKLRPNSIDAKLKRWQKIAREAAKQSKRTIVPLVMSPCLLGQYQHNHDLCVVPWESVKEPSLHAVYQMYPNAVSIGVLIGPEGGIEADEIRSSSFLPVTLGPRILRTETAGLCTLSVLFALYGDLA